MKDLKEGQTFKVKKRIVTAGGMVFKKGEKYFHLPEKYTKLEDYLVEVK